MPAWWEPGCEDCADRCLPRGSPGAREERGSVGLGGSLGARPWKPFRGRRCAPPRAGQSLCAISERLQQRIIALLLRGSVRHRRGPSHGGCVPSNMVRDVFSIVLAGRNSIRFSKHHHQSHNHTLQVHASGNSIRFGQTGFHWNVESARRITLGNRWSSRVHQGPASGGGGSRWERSRSSMIFL